MPKVSVIIPSYNHERFISQAIQSVLDQTYQDFEIIIVDDGSSDNSIAEIRRFSDDRIHLFCFTTNQGACLALKKLIAEAQGEYIALLNSDDIFVLDKLEKQVAFLDKNPNIGAAFGYAQIIDEDGNHFNDESHFYCNIFKQANRSRYAWLNYFFYNGNCLCHPSMLIRKKCYEEIKIYDSRFAQIPDQDFFIRLCLQYEIFIIPENLVKFRIRKHEENASGLRPDTRIRAGLEYIQVLKNYLTIDNVELFNQVFPNASMSLAHGEEKYIPFAVAQIAFAEKKYIHQYFAIDTLYKILSDEKIANLIAEKYKYTYADLIHMAGTHDVFNLMPGWLTTVYIDTGNDFNKDETIEKRVYLEATEFRIEFDLSSYSCINKVRWDPVENQFCKVKIATVSYIDDTGKHYLDTHSVQSNGMLMEDGYIVFHTIDPIFLFNISGEISMITIEGQWEFSDVYQQIEERRSAFDMLAQQLKVEKAYGKELEVQAENLNKGIAELEGHINEILSSHSWKISKPLRFIGKAIRNNVEKISSKNLARIVVSTYLSSALTRKIFLATKNTSNKLLRPWFPALHDGIFVDLKLKLHRQWLTGSGENLNSMPSNLYSLPQASQEIFQPKVSIIVPNYNHASYLRQRLESIYQQTYQNFEVILLDDASSDESTDILEEYRLRYPNNTICYFNKDNSGGVFYQWNRGFELAKGELIWIAESDDYCSDNLLTELVECFRNEAVMLAYCKTAFVEGDRDKQIWSLEEYLAELDPTLWQQPFVRSAHQLVNMSWAIKNIVPNVSSAVFRNPGRLELLENEEWKHMRICGDWVFYLHIIRGGLVAYTTKATNFYRIHGKNTSVATYKQDVYYQEHEKVATELVKLYRLQEGVLDRQQQILELHWRLCRGDHHETDFKTCYDQERIWQRAKERKTNLLMVTYALVAGGGETFPIKLANLLKSAGYGVTVLNCQREFTESGVRKMLRGDIPLLELDHIQKINAVVSDMGIEIVHSHHAWADVTICTLLETNPDCKVVVSTHGMYEMMSLADLNGLLPLLNKRVDKFVYTAEKNLAAFTGSIIHKSRFTKIDNALEIVSIFPIPRAELGINMEDFVLCMVSRAIPDKGWQEGIKAVRLARKLSGKEIHLLVIGEGPEYERLKDEVGDSFIHFLGFKANIRDYYATADLGFLPSKFRGESFPLVLIDCLQSGRPMLASDVGEIATMLEMSSGLAGSVFALDNWEIPINQVAELIAEYANNQDLYSEHLQRVPEAANKFDPKILLHNYGEVYREVIEDRKGMQT